MCDEGKEKRERSLDVSLFFGRISFGFVGKNDKNGVSPNEKAPICKSNDFGIVPGTNKRGVQNTI